MPRGMSHREHRSRRNKFAAKKPRRKAKRFVGDAIKSAQTLPITASTAAQRACRFNFFPAPINDIRKENMNKSRSEFDADCKMEDTPLAFQMKKVLAEESYACYLACLQEFPEGEWVAPTNGAGTGPRASAYTIFDDLYQASLVAKRVAPIWRNGSFCGQRVKFLYKTDLNYKEQ